MKKLNNTNVNESNLTEDNTLEGACMKDRKIGKVVCPSGFDVRSPDLMEHNLYSNANPEVNTSLSSFVEYDESGNAKSILGFSVETMEYHISQERLKPNAVYLQTMRDKMSDQILKVYGFATHQKIMKEDLDNEPTLTPLVIEQLLDDDKDTTGRVTRPQDANIQIQKFADFAAKEFWYSVKGSKKGLDLLPGRKSPMVNKIKDILGGSLKWELDVPVESFIDFTEEGAILKESTVERKVGKKIDGKWQMVRVQKTVADIVLFAESMGIIVDGTTSRVLVSHSSMSELVGVCSNDADYSDRIKEIIPGVVAVQPNYDADHASRAIRKDQEEIQYGRAGYITSNVATAESLWQERLRDMSNEDALNRITRAENTRRSMKEEGIKKYNNAVLDENPELVEAIRLMSEIANDGDIDNACTIAAENADDATLMLKICGVGKRTKDDSLQLPSKVYFYIKSLQEENLLVDGDEEAISLIDGLNSDDEEEVQEVLASVRGDIGMLRRIHAAALAGYRITNKDVYRHVTQIVKAHA